MWPSRSYDRLMQQRARRRRKNMEDFLAVAEIVLESVHPGNLGPLPPSPELIIHKARLLGLLKPLELVGYPDCWFL